PPLGRAQRRGRSAPRRRFPRADGDRRRPRLRRADGRRAARRRREPRPARHARARAAPRRARPRRRPVSPPPPPARAPSPERRGRPMIRALLAEAHHLVRAGLRALLDPLPDIEVVGEAGDGREALALLKNRPADVAILDISMPGMNGLEAAVRMAD